MRVFAFIFLLAASAFGQDLEISLRPDTIYVESIPANIVPMERVFFHLVIHNIAKEKVEIQWARFDIVNSEGVLFSGQYSDKALTALFDSAIDRKRIEPTPKGTLTLNPDERKAISDIYLDFPKGFIGESLLVEVDYKMGAKTGAQKLSTSLARADGMAVRLPFDGVWYVAAEHGYLDPHKRFLAEAYAYDFLQIGANGKSYQRDGTHNADYYAYGKKVLAAKDGTVVSVRTDIVENAPGETNINTPGGNAIVIDHGNNQYSYYAHLRPNSITVKVGAKVKAGDLIAEVGNSGDSAEPHLHFHLMNNADPGQADGLPVVFDKWTSQSYGANPIERHQGVLPKGEFVSP